LEKVNSLNNWSFSRWFLAEARPLSTDSENPLSPITANSPAILDDDDRLAGPRMNTNPGVWPVIISSIVFALMHWSHGPDPIPLFLLALGLGFIYRQTHRILPCIIVHFLLNLCSLTALTLYILNDSSP
jgi:hypothetical protein